MGPNLLSLWAKMGRGWPHIAAGESQTSCPLPSDTSPLQFMSRLPSPFLELWDPARGSVPPLRPDPVLVKKHLDFA